jgi:hypothetical protein
VIRPGGIGGPSGDATAPYYVNMTHHVRPHRAGSSYLQACFGDRAGDEKERKEALLF